MFQPGVKYTSVTWGMDTVEFTGETLAQHIHPADSVTTEIARGLSDGSGKFIVPTSIDEINKCKEYVSIWCRFGNMYYVSQFSGLINIRVDLIVFDNNNKLVFIGTPGMSEKVGYITGTTGDMMPMFVTDVLWSDRANYDMPNNLKTVTGIMSITSVTRP